MSKDAKNTNPESDRAEKESFEMIELAISDMEALTRAFDMIKEVCDQVAETEPEFEDSKTDYILN